MTARHRPTSAHVVIVGGGVAGLEALLALQALARDRVNLTLISQDDWFIDRPMTVGEPFGFGSAAHHSLPELVAERGADYIGDTVVAVHPDDRRVSCADRPDLSFDALILAVGARLSAPFADAITFGIEGSARAIEEMLERLRSGEARSATFVVPSETGWLLPLYELALMTARELVRNGKEGVDLRILTPEDRPLTMFGEQGSESTARLLAAAGIEFIGSSGMNRKPGPADYTVTLPLLRGPELAGVPTTGPNDFLPVDEHGRVTGLADVYAAGDAIDFPVKQGGLAAQQADAVAEHIAATYGASVDPAPFRPVLRGMLFAGDEPLYLRSNVPGADPGVPRAWYPLWWPPTKIAGRYLAPYLFERDDETGFGRPPAGFVDLDIPLSASTLPG